MTTMDIPGIYLRTDTDENIIMLLNDIISELMGLVEPKLCREYVTTYKNRQSMCMWSYKRPYMVYRGAQLSSTGS